ncbi:MAG: M48 family metallopeptidase [Inquilinaceae bacterium]
MPPAIRTRSLDIEGLGAPLEVRRDPRARRLTLRVDPNARNARVVAPPHVAMAEIRAFVARHRRWLQQRLDAVPEPRPFHDGATVPYLGADHRICHDPEAGRPVERLDGVFRVAGRPEHLARRLRDFLKAEARRELTRRSMEKAAMLGRRPAAITIRDTRSRWGSCSADGRLNYSWRLILAPEPVLDYVVAHEVAHLVEMNHGPRFWALTRRLCPDLEEPKTWLSVHGSNLHRHG